MKTVQELKKFFSQSMLKDLLVLERERKSIVKKLYIIGGFCLILLDFSVLQGDCTACKSLGLGAVSNYNNGTAGLVEV